MTKEQNLLGALDKYEFIVLAPNQWNSQWMNRQQIFSRIGKYADVVYSKGMKHSWNNKSLFDFFTHPINKSVIMDNIRVVEPSSLFVQWDKFPLISAFAKNRFIAEIDKNKHKNLKRILYIFHPNYNFYIDLIQHDVLIYHPFDNFSKQGVFDQKARNAEQNLIDKADIVMTPSKGVSLALSEQYGRENIETVHNGVDFKAFSNVSEATPGQSKNRVAYIGSINVKVDLAALLHLVQTLPTIQLELVGPVGNMSYKQNLYEELRQQKNVVFHGSKHYSELPEISASMDCLLMCYDTSPDLWAEHAYPLKLNEYLAVRRPVVSCPLPSVPGVENYLEIASNIEEWPIYVKKVLETPDQSKIEKGFEYAAKQDWNERVEQISMLINNVEK